MDQRIELRVLNISSSMAQARAYGLVLTEVKGSRQLPIIIGSSEAQAIAIKIKDVQITRPFTHDLFLSFSKTFDITLKEVFIYKVCDGIFYSYLYFEKGNQIYPIDSRTSDAIALAIRYECPIYTTESILESEGVQLNEDQEVVISNPTANLNTLEKALEDAVATENYELASQLRDEIRKQENKR